MVDGNGTSAGNSHQIVSAAARATVSCRKLRINPNNEVRPDNYEDLQLDFPNPVYKNLEKYLPPDMLVSNREERVRFMTDIMLSHLPSGERSKVHLSLMLQAQKHSDYRSKIVSNYQPLHRELYNLVPRLCFVPSFLKAINENTEDSFRSIISEASPGVFVFDMLLPSFCEMMLAEATASLAMASSDLRRPPKRLRTPMLSEVRESTAFPRYTCSSCLRLEVHFERLIRDAIAMKRHGEWRVSSLLSPILATRHLKPRS
ncbi:hypothetical protein DY000_02050113 [Brassica cretica]|uniref:Uncharacterized protein n=1 Tax=Brassica cretica TaxID=69181 RepID=A0ABQ7F158_BRACR|nr:hypothetical protein DY000_02050113 [Brassica cretica]